METDAGLRLPDVLRSLLGAGSHSVALIGKRPYLPHWEAEVDRGVNSNKRNM